MISGYPVHGRELTLRLMIWDGYAPIGVQKKFSEYVKAKYGVDLNFTIRYASNPDDFFDELRKGNVELISPAHNLPKDFRYNLTTNGLTLPIDLENIPNYKKLIPGLSEQSWATENGQVYAIPVVQGSYGLAYNVTMVKEEPTGWNILWDPQYKGRYAVHKDYYELNIYISALALGYDSASIFHYDRIKGPLLEDKIHGLAVNAGSFWEGFDKPGHYKNMALSTTWRCTFPEGNKEFQNWRIAVPKEGIPWWIDTMMISHTLKDRPLLRRIAEEWINYILEPEVQTSAIAMALGTYPVTAEALELYIKSLPDTSHRENLNLLLKNKIPWEILEIRDRNAFKLLWDEAQGTRGTRK